MRLEPPRVEAVQSGLDGLGGVRLEPVLEAIKEQAPPPVDLTPVLEAIKEQAPPPVDLTPVLEAITHLDRLGGMRLEPPRVEAVQSGLDGLGGVRLEPVLEAMKEVQSGLDGLGGVRLEPVLEPIKEQAPPSVDLTPVLE